MGAPLRITHVIPRIGLTGPVRTLAAFVKYAERLDLSQTHRVLALEQRASPLAQILLRREGITCELGPDPDVFDAAFAEADVVLLHWWSCPSIVDFLMRPMPPGRIALWSHVHGAAPPQVLTQGVVDAADSLLLTTAATLELPVLHDGPPLRPPVLVPAIGDMDQLEEFAPVAHDGVVVGYLGTVNRAKMHPRFVAMCAAVDAPDARFVVVGSGGEEQELEQQAETAGISDRFEVRGYAKDLAPALGEMDVFGYPLREGTYASSEIALQEAMWVGIPPVVFPYGGVRHLVEHGRTGLVAHSEAEYSEHVATLVRDPELRARLGAQAKAFARRAFDPEGPTRAMDAALRATAALDARPRRAPAWGPSPGAWFAHSLGDAGAPFLAELAAPGDPEAVAAIAALDPATAGGEGGLFHWCNHFPDDSALRRWAEIRGGASTP